MRRQQVAVKLIYGQENVLYFILSNKSLGPFSLGTMAASLYYCTHSLPDSIHMGFVYPDTAVITITPSLTGDPCKAFRVTPRGGFPFFSVA